MQHRDPASADGRVASIRFLIDANVDAEAGSVLASRGHDVSYVVQVFPDGTPDGDIDAFARIEGWIIVSHDRRFMRVIQQPRYNFDISVTTGYGRVMLCGPESGQRIRLEETIDLIELCYSWALRNGRRFLLTIGLNWIRYDDRPLVTRSPASH